MIAKIKKVNSIPTLFINGTAFPPNHITTRTLNHEYLCQIRNSNIRVFYVFANTDWMQPHKEIKNSDGTVTIHKSGFESFCDEVYRLLDAVPDAYIIVRIGLHPPVSWAIEHPDDIVTYDDGTHIPCNMCSEIHYDRMPGSYSMCSDNWRKDASLALEDFCNKVDNSKFSEHVAGYFLAAGGTSEWYYMNRLTDRVEHSPEKPDRIADNSKAFKQYYSKFLKEKYITNKNLRYYWKDNTADINNPYIPNLKERQYITASQDISKIFINLENISKYQNAKKDTQLGVFLNAETCQDMHDFLTAWHRGTAESIIEFAKTIKKKYHGNRVVGAFYGSLGCTDYFDSSTATATDLILDSGYIDFLAAPGVYNNREPGGCTAQREMRDSFAIRNTIFISEDDTRTHLDNNFFKNSMGVYSFKETENILKREFGRNICQCTSSWWFDQHPEGGRYFDAQILKLFKTQQKISIDALNNNIKNNDIAILYDLSSIHYVSNYTNSYMLDFYRTSDLNSFGTGTDYYFLNDVKRKDMPDYKLYIAINAFSLSEDLRKAIISKAKKNNAVILWLYAPGFINPDVPSMNAQNITNITGMNVDISTDIGFPAFTVTSEHPIVKYAVKGRKYGYIDKDIYSNVWLGSNLIPAFLCPSFSIQDESVTVLGKNCITGKTALAYKETYGVHHIYCTSQIMRKELLTSAAEFAGCHIYSYDGDTLYVSEKYLCIHASYTGIHTLYFKYPCSPYEVYEQKSYGNYVTSLELSMEIGKTLMFYLMSTE